MKTFEGNCIIKEIKYNSSDNTEQTQNIQTYTSKKWAKKVLAQPKSILGCYLSLSGCPSAFFEPGSACSSLKISLDVTSTLFKSCPTLPCKNETQPSCKSD